LTKEVQDEIGGMVEKMDTVAPHFSLDDSKNRTAFTTLDQKRRSFQEEPHDDDGVGYDGFQEHDRFHHVLLTNMISLM